MNEFLQQSIQIIGFILIWAAIGYGRKEDSKIKWFTKGWFIVFGLMTLGTYLINNTHKWFN